MVPFLERRPIANRDLEHIVVQLGLLSSYDAQEEPNRLDTLHGPPTFELRHFA